MALCATSTIMLGEVTAQWCFCQASVFHELKNIAREVSSHRKHSKMALCATSTIMLGEVTAQWCFCQASVFHELKNIAREISSHRKHSKMALCATSTIMLGEVTAQWCFCQASVFHELKNIAREVSSHRKHSKMALCATSTIMLGEVTAQWCFCQASVFHELNASSVLKAVSYNFMSSIPICATSFAPSGITASVALLSTHHSQRKPHGQRLLRLGAGPTSGHLTCRLSWSARLSTRGCQRCVTTSLL